MKTLFSALVLTFALAPTFGADRDAADLKLWYDKPAAKWVEALPIGNGRLGAMIFGGTADERIQFNEDTIWTGAPHEYQHEGALKFLPQIRQQPFDQLLHLSILYLR